MTKEEQIKLTTDLCDSIKEHMINHISMDHVPDNWDGFEIRHWLLKISEFEDILSDRIRNKPYRKRKRDSENTMIVNNLY
jgi:hypothetical protein